MAGEPAEPPASGDPTEIGQRTRQDERTDQHERTGPVAIARHVKDDGRALILYTRDTRART